MHNGSQEMIKGQLKILTGHLLEFQIYDAQWQPAGSCIGMAQDDPIVFSDGMVVELGEAGGSSESIRQFLDVEKYGSHKDLRVHLCGCEVQDCQVGPRAGEPGFLYADCWRFRGLADCSERVSGHGRVDREFRTWPS